MTLAIPYEACPICGSASIEKEREDDCTAHAAWRSPLPETLAWMRCRECGHSFTQTYWTEEGLREVFAMTHKGQIAGSGENPDHRRSEWAETVTSAVDLLGGYAQAMSSSEPPVWIDVGCGNGYLMMLANEIGFAELGLDMRPATVDMLQKLSYNAVLADFNWTDFTRPASVISMMDVLEHMPFPVLALRKARDSLVEGGLLVLSLPSQSACSWRIRDKVATHPYWIEIEHHHNFTPDRLRRILDAVGFRIERLRFPNRYVCQVEIYARRV